MRSKPKPIRVPSQGGMWEQKVDSLFGVLALVLAMKAKQKRRRK